MKQWRRRGLGEVPPAGMGSLLLEGPRNWEAAQVMTLQGLGSGASCYG